MISLFLYISTIDSRMWTWLFDALMRKYSRKTVAVIKMSRKHSDEIACAGRFLLDASSHPDEIVAVYRESARKIICAISKCPWRWFSGRFVSEPEFASHRGCRRSFRGGKSEWNMKEGRWTIAEASIASLSHRKTRTSRFYIFVIAVQYIIEYWLRGFSLVALLSVTNEAHWTRKRCTLSLSFTRKGWRDRDRRDWPSGVSECGEKQENE